MPMYKSAAVRLFDLEAMTSCKVSGTKLLCNDAYMQALTPVRQRQLPEMKVGLNVCCTLGDNAAGAFPSNAKAGDHAGCATQRARV